jgi:hypothetical protein
VKADHKNVTLSVPESLLRKFRIYAASHNQSMNSLLVNAMRKLVDNRDEEERAHCRFVELMKNAPDRGTGGQITWTRDEIHER